MNKNRLVRNWLMLLGLVFFLVFAGRAYLSFLKSSVDPKGQVRAFVIQKGETVASVAQRLEDEGLIRSAWAFKLTLKRRGQGNQIEPGDFKLSSAMSAEEIISALRSGPVDKWVRLIEGWRVEEMAQELNSKFKIQSSKFIAAAKEYEGYLFPDTYLINPDATPEEIVATLRDNFDKKYDEELQNKVKKLGLTPRQGVVLASIVEREARSQQARTEVAGILLKRLKIGMALQTDATVQYALGYQPSEKSWWKRHLSRDDLKADSPFNTYLYPGLPPAPIANPSLSSLKAVAGADPSTPYLYYYHDSQGRSHYGRTLDEHNQNVANNP